MVQKLLTLADINSKSESRNPKQIRMIKIHKFKTQCQKYINDRQF
ncbi:hypothetical protein D1AOALGA4SA_3793 [Olavius algarvensis Delta 1 endosymbiont]|nr:hypothetical protein D1AOALGA4SA_3793 [Olavius algarvensis Delta 1 endosymbiont]